MDVPLFFRRLLRRPLKRYPEGGLKDAFKGYFKIGTSVSPWHVRHLGHMISFEFNSLTADNAMKPCSTEPQKGRFYWEKADRIANFCRRKGIKLRGHTLMWHKQIGSWMYSDKDGSLLSKEEFYANMKEHIFAIVRRYKDVVYAWDVVNEAIAEIPTNPDQPLRESPMWQIAGEEFIYKAFEYAHEADPDALLFYNDYGEANPEKSKQIFSLVKRMKEAGIPIDGIGMQGHYDIYSPSPEEVDHAISRFKTLVKHIHITELDLRIHPGDPPEWQEQIRGEPMRNASLSKKEEEQQIQRYVDFFRVFMKHADVIDCVSFWNLGDRDSWLGVANSPLLFDVYYLPKKSYFAIKNLGLFRS